MTCGHKKASCSSLLDWETWNSSKVESAKCAKLLEIIAKNWNLNGIGMVYITHLYITFIYNSCIGNNVNKQVIVAEPELR